MQNNTIAEYAAMIAFGIVGLVLGLQKVIKGWKESSAETSVITLMHEELERMSKQNKILTEELNKLQIEIMNLNTQLRTLTDENQKLHREVTTLTAEVSRLKTLLSPA